MRARTMLEPVDAERLAFAGIVAVVRHESLARDEVQLPVAIQIDQRRGVPLRPRIVDLPARPFASLALLEPEHAVVVRRPPR